MTSIVHRVAMLVLLLAVAATAEAGAPPATGEQSADKPAAASPRRAPTGGWSGEGQGVRATAETPKPLVRVTISKETTYITEPLRPDGYPDYAAALNRWQSEGVTPENNAAVLFWKAMGPAHVQPARRDKFYELLGMPPPPERGDYFISLASFAKRLVEAEKAGSEEWGTAKEAEAGFSKQLDQAMKRRWSKKEFPFLAEWLTVNEKPLALVIEASKRPRCYNPEVWPDDPSPPSPECPLEPKESYYQAAYALVGLAMLELGDGRANKSWEDLVACHRLARLVAQGPTFGDLGAGHLAEATACVGDLALLQDGHLPSARIREMRDDLQRLRPMPTIAEKFDRGERLDWLYSFIIAARDGPKGWGWKDSETPASVSFTFAVMDWDVALRITNKWSDCMVEACRKPTLAARREAEETVRKAMEEARSRLNDPKSFAFAALRNPRRAWSERFVRNTVPRWLSRISKTTGEAEGMTQLALTKLAFALAAYRVDRGSYPAKLADLTPKYVTEVPKDIFADADLHYAREGGGYLLYSVGPNGKDDGGKGYDDAKDNGEDWDDIAVRMTPPK
jgi:hypothetical protein